MLLNSHPRWTQRTALQTGEATKETVEVKQPPTFTAAQTPEAGWQQNILSERSDGLEIQTAIVPHRQMGHKAESSPRPLRTGWF